MNDAVKEVQIRAGILHRRVQSGDQTALKRFRRPAGPTRCGAHINLWYRTRAHAAEVWRQRGGYLLAFRRQFLIVDRFYIETLGLDPDDAAWRALGFDWTRPDAGDGACIAARRKLYSALVALMPREMLP
ncbi:MAG: hypothetical protein FJW20_14305 [Acidimicrobiia bacterium]|nr:hypothetical protein [Acidimicrobiia bacterium]